MPKYFNTVTQEIVDYPADAAAVIPALKLVPSEKAKDKQDESAPVAATKTEKKSDAH